MAGDPEQVAATRDREQRADEGASQNKAHSAKEMGEETICMGDVYQLFLHFYFVKGLKRKSNELGQVAQATGMPEATQTPESESAP